MGKYASKDTTPGSMIWPGAGIAVSTGSAWGTSITPSTGYLYYNGSTYSWDTKATMFTSPVFTGTGKMNGSFEIQESGVKKWTIVSESGTFTFKNASDVTKGILDQNGNFYVQGEVAAFATGSPTNWWDSMPVPTTTTRGGILLYDTADTTHFLRGDGTWQTVTSGIGSYPGAGIVVSTGSAWGTSITDNSANWNSAYTHSQAVHQSIINGTGFVKASGTTLSYDNNTYSLSSHNHSGTYEPANSNIQTHINSTGNPHVVTASQVGLGNVTNESKSTMFSSPTFTGNVYFPGSGIWNSSGNVGIGTTSPQYLLHIYHATTGGTMVIGSGSTGNATLALDSANGDGLGGDYYIIKHKRSGNLLSMGYDGADSLIINSTGNVGIGTTSPQNLLNVNGIMRWGGTTSNYTYSSTDGGGLWLENCGSDSSRSKIRFQSSKSSDGTNYTQLIIDPYNGVSITNIGTGNSNLNVSGEVTAYYSSDRFLKQNIRQFSALDKIDLMNPVAFQWNIKAKELNNSKDDRTNYGFIAQEIEAIMPELVHSIYGEYKSLDYTQIIPILTQAIKELREENKMFRNELNTLKHGS